VSLENGVEGDVVVPSKEVTLRGSDARSVIGVAVVDDDAESLKNTH
jgi:hypothetical protein